MPWRHQFLYNIWKCTTCATQKVHNIFYKWPNTSYEIKQTSLLSPWTNFYIDIWQCSTVGNPKAHSNFRTWPNTSCEINQTSLLSSAGQEIEQKGLQEWLPGFIKQKQSFSSPYDMHVEIVGLQPKSLFFIVCYRSITMISDRLILEGIHISEVPYKQLENPLHGPARQFQIIKIYYNDFR